MGQIVWHNAKPAQGVIVTSAKSNDGVRVSVHSHSAYSLRATPIKLHYAAAVMGFRKVLREPDKGRGVL